MAEHAQPQNGQAEPSDSQDKPYVDLRNDGDVAFLSLARPPANLLTAPMRRAILDALEQLDADGSVVGIVLTSTGRGFCKGRAGDTLDTVQSSPTIDDLCARIEACDKPVVAAMRGVVNAEGAALALASHARVADQTARFAFPDMSYGLIPDGGACIRLSALVGVDKALKWLMNSSVIVTKEALKSGLVNDVCDGNPRPVAADFARRLAKDSLRPTSSRREAFSDIAAVQSAVSDLPTGPEGGVVAQLRGCIEAACLLPTPAALERCAVERADGLAHPQSRAQRHLHFAQSRAARPKNRLKGRKTVRVVGISVGQSAQNAQSASVPLALAMLAIDSGYITALKLPDARNVAPTQSMLKAAYEGAVGAGLMAGADRDERLSRIRIEGPDMDLSHCDAVIEATTGSAADRVKALIELEKTLPSEIALATVSDHGTAQMVRAIAHPERFCAAHVFAPVQPSSVVELAKFPATNTATYHAFHDIFTRMKKCVVTLTASEKAQNDGFVANRLQQAALSAVDIVLLMGARPSEVDAAMTSFGAAQGYCAMMDALGTHNFQGTAAKSLTARGVPFFDATGDDSAAVAVFDGLREEVEVRARTLSSAEIIGRIVLAQANAGAWLVERGLVHSPSDIDVIMVQAMGFARTHGGPMQWADRITPLAARKALVSYAHSAPDIWTPAPIWGDLIKEGLTFDLMNDFNA